MGSHAGAGIRTFRNQPHTPINSPFGQYDVLETQWNQLEARALERLPRIGLAEHLMSADFRFESFQNWRSEFLAIVLLGLWLRQKDSPRSKPLEAPHMQTGSWRHETGVRT